MDIQQLIKKAKAGDEKAFSRLYHQTYNRNYYIVQKMVKSEQDTQDILQDTYIKVYTHLDNYQHDSPGGFAAWTAKIATNTALSHLRRKNPVLFSEMEQETEDGVMELEWEDETPDYKPEVAFDKKETAMIIQELLESLSEEQRICILMYYLEDMSVKEIAQQCSCSENTVKSRLNYGRKNIQKQGEVLKKKGIPLYHVAPLTLLLYLLKKETADAAEKATVFARFNFQKIIIGIVIAALGAGVGTGIYIHSKSQELKPVTTEQPFFSLEPSATVVPTADPVVEATKIPKEKPRKEKPDKTQKPVSKPTERPTPRPTPKPTSKPTPKPTPKPKKKTEKKNNNMEWDDDYVEWEE